MYLKRVLKVLLKLGLSRKKIILLRNEKLLKVDRLTGMNINIAIMTSSSENPMVF